MIYKNTPARGRVKRINLLFSNRTTLYSVAKNVDHVKLLNALANRNYSSHFSRSDSDPRINQSFAKMLPYCKMLRSCEGKSCLLTGVLSDFCVQHNQVSMCQHETFLGRKRLPVHSLKKYSHYSKVANMPSILLTCK